MLGYVGVLIKLRESVYRKPPAHSTKTNNPIQKLSKYKHKLYADRFVQFLTIYRTPGSGSGEISVKDKIPLLRAQSTLLESIN